MLRLNLELFKDCKDPSDMSGDLGYPMIFKTMGFREVRRELDYKNRVSIECEIIQIDRELFEILPKAKNIKFEGTLFLLEKDLIKV